MLKGIRKMVDRILNGDKTIDVTDIVKLINKRRKQDENRR
jgi:hypothetical protein